MERCLCQQARSGARRILFSLSGLLISCSSVEGPLGRRTSADGEATQQFEMSDNFGVYDLEQRFQTVTRQVAPAVVAISATDAKFEND